MLEFLCGVGPASEWARRWLDAHPWASAVAILLAVLVAGCVR